MTPAGIEPAIFPFVAQNTKGILCLNNRGISSIDYIFISYDR